jgi:hypothetical protein
MTEKTRTTVVIESHQQTIVRRSRRTVSGHVLMDGAIARPLGRARSDETEHPVQEKRKSPERWWKTVALKGATAYTTLSRRLKARANERRNRLS